MTELDRRTVLRGAGAAGALVVAAPVLAACGPSQSNTSTSGPVTVGTGSVPVQGGVISGGVVVTQPEKGTFKAFSSTCTHQGCTVGSVDSNVISCPCHGSMFSAQDGSVIQGPATAPLPAKTAKVSGSDVVVS